MASLGRCLVEQGRTRTIDEQSAVHHASSRTWSSHLVQLLRNRIDALDSLNARQRDAFRTNLDNIAISFVEFYMSLMRITTPDNQKSPKIREPSNERSGKRAK